MKRRHKIYFMLLAMSALLLGGCGNPDETGGTGSGQTSESVSSEEASSQEEHSGIIVFEGQDIQGNEVTSDIFGNARLTMVNVWATFCNPCLREMPDLGELAGEYDSGEFQIIGVISDVQAGDEDMITQASDLIARTGADYTHLLLNESLYYALLTEVTGVPTTFFINENGELLGTVEGAKEKSVWEEIINGLLEEL